MDGLFALCKVTRLFYYINFVKQFWKIEVLFTYLLSYLLTSLLTYFLTYLLTYLLPYLLTLHPQTLQVVETYIEDESDKGVVTNFGKRITEL